MILLMELNLEIRKARADVGWKMEDFFFFKLEKALNYGARFDFLMTLWDWAVLSLSKSLAKVWNRKYSYISSSKWIVQNNLHNVIFENRLFNELYSQQRSNES